MGRRGRRAAGDAAGRPAAARWPDGCSATSRSQRLIAGRGGAGGRADIPRVQSRVRRRPAGRPSAAGDGPRDASTRSPTSTRSGRSMLAVRGLRLGKAGAWSTPPRCAAAAIGMATSRSAGRSPMSRWPSSSRSSTASSTLSGVEGGFGLEPRRADRPAATSCWRSSTCSRSRRWTATTWSSPLLPARRPCSSQRYAPYGVIVLLLLVLLPGQPAARAARPRPLRITRVLIGA